mmetsp:Transcript_42229/g.109208  ORF Transcript_42229/g.109208 Transcript_42229/m.109208 type:complete len:276 (-) Transcript_42229:120-947(-)
MWQGAWLRDSGSAAGCARSRRRRRATAHAGRAHSFQASKMCLYTTMALPFAMVLRARPGTRPRYSRPELAASRSSAAAERPAKCPLCLWLFTTSIGQHASQPRFAQRAPVQKGPRPPGMRGGRTSAQTEKVVNRITLRPIVTELPSARLRRVHTCACFICEATLTLSNGASTMPRPRPPAAPAKATCQSMPPMRRACELSRRDRTVTSYTPNCTERNREPPTNMGRPPLYRPRKPSLPSSRRASCRALVERASGRACIVVLIVSSGWPTTTDVSP